MSAWGRGWSSSDSGEPRTDAFQHDVFFRHSTLKNLGLCELRNLDERSHAVGEARETGEDILVQH